MWTAASLKAALKLCSIPQYRLQGLVTFWHTRNLATPVLSPPSDKLAGRPRMCHAALEYGTQS